MKTNKNIAENVNAVEEAVIAVNEIGAEAAENVNEIGADAAENVNEIGADAAEDSPELAKAKSILRARLPKLSEAGLNLEKRTGRFFKATLAVEKVKDEDGNDTLVDLIGSDGKPVEKVRRLVVETTGEDGELLPEFADCAEDIAAKLAAVTVAAAEKEAERLECAIECAAFMLGEAKRKAREHREAVTAANDVVMGYVLPERAPRATSERVSAKLASVQDENAKLRAQLIAMGIDPDAIA